VFKTLNPFSSFNRKQIRDLEAELRGRGGVDETVADPVVRPLGNHAGGRYHRGSTTVKALNPFSAFNRKQIRDLEAELRGRGGVDETVPSEATGGPTVPSGSGSHESKP
jgi:hypothetical protein